MRDNRFRLMMLMVVLIFMLGNNPSLRNDKYSLNDSFLFTEFSRT